MVKNNGYIIPKKIKRPVETVYEMKEEYKVPSFEEFMKSYERDEEVNYDDLSGGSIGEVKGYGPCLNTLCGCSCSSRECVCTKVEKSIDSAGGDTYVGSFTSYGRKRWDDSLDGKLDLTAVRFCDEGEKDVRIGSISVGGTATRTGVDVRGGINAIDYKSNGFQARVGLNADTAAKVDEDGLKLKFLGAGVNIGRKMELSTPFGGVSKDTDCVVQ